MLKLHYVIKSYNRRNTEEIISKIQSLQKAEAKKVINAIKSLKLFDKDGHTKGLWVFVSGTGDK